MRTSSTRSQAGRQVLQQTARLQILHRDQRNRLQRWTKLTSRIHKQESIQTHNQRPQRKRAQLVGQFWLPPPCRQRRFATSGRYQQTFCRHSIGEPSNTCLNFICKFALSSRFLPCNSHHIRDGNPIHHPAPNPTAHIHVRPVQRRTVSLDRSSVRQPAATLHVPSRDQQPQQASTSTRSRRIVDVNNITDEELNHRFSLFGIQLSLRDLDQLAPSFYNAQRDDLRAFLSQNYFSNGEINEQTVSVAIRDILLALEKYLERLSIFTHPDYDVRKSIENLIMKSLPFIINLITDDSSSEFGVRIERQMITFCENVYMILVKCIGVRETEKYLNEVANMVMTGGSESVGNLSRFPRYIIQTFLIERRSYDLSEIQEFLIIKRPSAPTVRFTVFSIFPVY